jgi:hypothetical protein
MSKRKRRSSTFLRRNSNPPPPQSPLNRARSCSIHSSEVVGRQGSASVAKEGVAHNPTVSSACQRRKKLSKLRRRC